MEFYGHIIDGREVDSIVANRLAEVGRGGDHLRGNQ